MRTSTCKNCKHNISERHSGSANKYIWIHDNTGTAKCPLYEPVAEPMPAFIDGVR